jgi:hypothetical protein
VFVRSFPKKTLDRTPPLRYGNYAHSDSACSPPVTASGKRDRQDDVKMPAVRDADGFANCRPQAKFSGSAGVPFSPPGLNIRRQRGSPRSRMASFFRGHRALARREASLRAANPVAILGIVGRASLCVVGVHLGPTSDRTEEAPLWPSVCHGCRFDYDRRQRSAAGHRRRQLWHWMQLRLEILRRQISLRRMQPLAIVDRLDERLDRGFRLGAIPIRLSVHVSTSA